jgi:hypothetical protein
MSKSTSPVFPLFLVFLIFCRVKDSQNFPIRIPQYGDGFLTPAKPLNRFIGKGTVNGEVPGVNDPIESVRLDIFADRF